MAVFPSDSIRTKSWGTEVLTSADQHAQLDLLHAYFQAALNSSTGHTHDGTSNQGPKLAYSGVATTFGNGFTTVTAASGDYVLIASDVSDSNTTKKALVSDIITASTFTPSASNALAGSVVQFVTNIGQSTFGKSANLAFGATDNGTTAAVYDDTIPQNTEGDQYMQLAITPTNASNKLLINVVFVGYTSLTGNNIIALFQDTTANALSSSFNYTSGALAWSLSIQYVMAAGTTSATTFKVRAGTTSGGTLTFNGEAAARKLGGVSGSSMTITEIKV